MKTIGIRLTGKPSNGGSYQYWLNVLESVSLLEKSRFQVICYSQFPDWEKITAKLGLEFRQEEVSSKIIDKVIDRYLEKKCSVRFLRKYSYRWKPFVKQLKEDQIDLWMSQTLEIADKYLGIPSIVPVFDLMHRYRRDIPELQEQFKMRDELYSYEAKVASMILVDSEVGKQQIVECYGDKVEKLTDKVRVLPFSPPDYIYNGNPKKIEGLFDKYMFYPAQFWTHKNHVRLLEAIHLLKKEGKILNLILVGSEQNNQITIKEWIKKYEIEDQVKILGYVENEEMIYLYQHARTLVMPTLFGPTNIPQLEAFELGCPVATSRIYGIPDQVGDAAILFDPENVDEIKASIEQLWFDDELCKTLVKKGYEKAKKWTRKDFSSTLIRFIEEFNS